MDVEFGGTSGTSIHLLPPFPVEKLATHVTSSDPFHSNNVSLYVAVNSSRHCLRNGLQKHTNPSDTTQIDFSGS